MPRVPPSFYARYRRCAPLGGAFHDDKATGTPPERLLQAVWHHQRIRRAGLSTVDGRTLAILHPGFWNREAGPDFRDAIVQFGSEPPTTGDVEIDLQGNGWHSHGHDRNPAFRKVILHVIWQGAPEGVLPTLTLQDRLDAPLPELSEWLGAEGAQEYPLALAGQCAGPLKDLPADALSGLLQQAGLCRLRGKAAHFLARARQSGWEQALWEGLFRALGYKYNAWPMQRLAEVIAPGKERERAPALVWQARLLGVAGLLPADGAPVALRADRGGNRKSGYVRRLWDTWWRERDEFSEVILPQQLWRFSGLRPANHPQRRLALAAHWLASGDLPARLERWFTSSLPDKALASSLLAVLQPKADDFWCSHWTLNAAAVEKPRPLLGGTRATDLAINVILPWLWARADAGGNDAMRQLAEARYLAWPPAEDNSVLKLARQRLLGGRALAGRKAAALQQGLLQIVRDFCDHSNAICEQCRFPELVREFQGKPRA